MDSPMFQELAEILNNEWIQQTKLFRICLQTSSCIEMLTYEQNTL